MIISRRVLIKHKNFFFKKIVDLFFVFFSISVSTPYKWMKNKQKLLSIE